MSIEKVQLKKQLQSQLATKQANAEAMKQQVISIQRQYDLLKNDIAKLIQRIKELDGDGELKVSEHAYLRYFERVLGYDLKVVESEILTNELKNMIAVLGSNGEYPVKDFSVKMKNGTVVTIIKNQS